MSTFPIPSGGWPHIADVPPRSFVCGFCNHLVSSVRGWNTTAKPQGHIRICGHCNRPTFFVDGTHAASPGPLPGKPVLHLPKEIEHLYGEARMAMSATAHTAAVLTMRKILMHVAVDCGAAPNLSFAAYVTFLSDNNYVPPRAKAWVDKIRKSGNEATHEIVIIEKPGADELLGFTEMLLKLIYEFPALGGSPAAAGTGP
jgi:hypothetical protein